MASYLVDIRLFDNMRILHGAQPVELDSPRLRSLLAYLILHRGTPQPRQDVAATLWPGSKESQARTNLRNLLYRLGQHLPDASRLMQLQGQTIFWRPEAPARIDVQEFEALVSQACTPERIEEAIAMYRGGLLPSCYEDWIVPERERLHRIFERCLSDCIALLEAQRDYQTAIRFARRLVQHDPLQEEAYRRLMHLYALCDDPSSATQVYATCVESLRRELGIRPSAATQELY